ncbi:hypothetical protein KR038_005426 [Drosophila bunnanda]|nr:hypothetical protein KR038_005426 [Drosophila bunnanda]
MNTHYLTTSRVNPQFYTFSQFFEDHCDWEASRCDWEAVLQAAWQNFWQSEGHELLELKWHKRFPEYKSLINIVTPEEQTFWQELWEKHATDLSAKFWRILNCALENYQNQLAKSFGTSLEQVEDDFLELNITEKLSRSQKRKRDKQPEINEDDVFFLSSTNEYRDLNEDEQLKLLGLPTSFGTQTCPNQNKQRKELHESSSSDYSNYSEEVLIMECDRSLVLHGVHGGLVTKKQKPKKKKTRKKTSMPEFMQNETKSQMVKYWLKRFSLFSRFDQGIRLDRESWFSVTPEKIAKQTARRLSCDLIVDAFCGCGGNAIQFANTCGRVIAIDIDAEKLAMAKHNAGIYGVAHKIEFIQADFLQFAVSSRIHPNAVFLSPPWGGPGYQKQPNFDIERNLLPVGASELMKLARRLADTVGFFLPRNSNMTQVVALSGAGQQCEVEHNFLDTRMVALTAYYGNGVIRNHPPDADAAQ